MQNVEYKAELRDISLAKTLCGAVGASWVSTLEQTDTYYRVADAKLKRRECIGYEPEWVFYNRSSRPQPKLSNFTIYSDAQAQQRFGAVPLPVLCVVKKRRELYMSRHGVRIHLDHVEGLGDFIEFEALVCPERSLSDAHAQVEELRRAFRPAMGEAIAAGYADLACLDAANASSSGE
jgi:adenylate cyclase class IV